MDTARAGCGDRRNLATPTLVSRIAPRRLLAGGLALAAAGAAVLVSVDDGGLPTLVGGLVLIFAGLLPVSTVAIDTVVTAVPPARAGSASALSETFQELGTAFGIAALGSLATAVYRVRLDGPLLTSLSAARAEAARDSLGGLLGAQPPFPDTVAAAGREALARGVQVASTTPALGLLATAILTAIALCRARPSTRPEPDLARSSSGR